MGCDIHGWIEIKVGDKYIAVKELADRNRNYARFAALAGVRDRGDNGQVKPNGLPVDISDTAKYDAEQLGIDGHSHSYMPLSDAAQIFLATSFSPNGYETSYPESGFFDVGEDDGDYCKYRLVFWFDS